MRFFKNLLIWGILAGILYILLSNHFIFFGIKPKILKKSELTLNYTFYSAKGKTNRHILAIDELRRDGIADLLMEMGLMSETEYDRLMTLYGGEEEEY